MDQGQGQAIADLYNLQKELLVVNGVCQEYCPMQGNANLDLHCCEGDHAAMGTIPLACFVLICLRSLSFLFVFRLAWCEGTFFHTF